MTNKGGVSPITSSGDGEDSRPTIEVPLGPYLRVIKPTIDRVLGFILLLLFSPVILIAAIIILITSGRPVFYSQDRVGLNGRHFRLYKLRTMIPDRRVASNGFRGEDRRQKHKSPNDPRVKGVGKALRAFRLDELPQFWNVVKGDMSLVGPRPEIPDIVNRYQAWQHRRHAVKPGVTGPWQVSKRNGKAMHECTEMDIEYIEQAAFIHDLKILVETPLAMFGRHGF